MCDSGTFFLHYFKARRLLVVRLDNIFCFSLLNRVNFHRLSEENGIELFAVSGQDPLITSPRVVLCDSGTF